MEYLVHLVIRSVHIGQNQAVSQILLQMPMFIVHIRLFFKIDGKRML